MDFNADLGEGGKEDAVLMQYISSCSIACGGHYGTFDTVLTTLKLAQKNSVAVGAHPAYPDPEHFGRRYMKMEKAAFQETIFNQLNTFSKALEEVGLGWQHIKAHGALYNAMITDDALATQYFEVILHFPHAKGVYLPVGQALVNTAENMGIHVWQEGFADRGYHSNGRLIARAEPNAVLTTTEAVLLQVEKWQQGNAIPSQTRTAPCYCDTLCLHSDTPNAIQHAKALHKRFNFKPLTWK